MVFNGQEFQIETKLYLLCHCVFGFFFSFARPITLKKREILGRSFEKFFMIKIVPLPYILFIV